MADSLDARLTGVDELKRAIAALPRVLRSRVLRNALAAGAREVRGAARAAAPVLTLPTRRRKPGTVRDAIVVRTSKIARRAGDVGVYVGIRPLRGARERKLGRRGADNPNDPYYWWWQEFGWVPRGPGRKSRTGRRMPGRKFVSTAAQRTLPQALSTVLRTVVPQIEKLNAKGALGVR